jgi:hypothetical protein
MYVSLYLFPTKSTKTNSTVVTNLCFNCDQSGLFAVICLDAKKYKRKVILEILYIFKLILLVVQYQILKFQLSDF